jgi:hypothetical protein
MLTENKNFWTTKLDVSFVLSDEITCLQKTKLDIQTKLDVTFVKTQCFYTVNPGPFHHGNKTRHSF